MERLSDIAGLPVVCIDSGKIAGRIKEPVFTPEGNEVAGFCISTGGFGSSVGLIFIEDILDVGRDAVLIFDESSVERRKKVIKEYTQRDKWSFMNKKVLTKDGNVLGIVKDGVFDAKTGRINEIELSLGVFEDLRNGRRVLPLGMDTEFGQDFIVVSKGGEGKDES